MLSGLLFLGLFAFLAQIDGPTLQIVHSFTHPAIDHIGTIGNHIGDGVTLVLISLGIGAVGFRFGWPTWKSASIHTLLAHGVAGLFTQILKHTIGRPRPRLKQGQDWEMAPSLESGWDSFPSGHTTASFAVATVLAYHFPKAKMLWFGLAAFSGACRVITGAHFPTDVLGGVLVGIGTALIIIHPPEKWKTFFQRTLTHGLPWLITAFGIVWISVPHPGMELEPSLSLFLGLIAIVIGLGQRLWWIRELSSAGFPSAGQMPPQWPRLVMGLGLATTTGSAVVLGASLMAGIIWWRGTQSELTTECRNRFYAGLNPMWIEVIIGLGIFSLTIVTFVIRSGSLLPA
ncbi:phosphatase PAP2 family protein [Candidatus Nitrospira neomarina]|uniref:Phosphatase PAP2 family protein n=1 Tax=Candidatus Nitrospira neomarina TaxID=3020899 RepID=A0AA96GGH7_9BACT|nr:phosphatase PAP2 family protein [Candidatus Nitrospira neomarina]WNM60542.1 phosphatase PAP2 family protein [Candidatus Nitrospira neomarina]